MYKVGRKKFEHLIIDVIIINVLYYLRYNSNTHINIASTAVYSGLILIPMKDVLFNNTIFTLNPWEINSTVHRNCVSSVPIYPDF